MAALGVTPHPARVEPPSSGSQRRLFSRTEKGRLSPTFFLLRPLRASRSDNHRSSRRTTADLPSRSLSWKNNSLFSGWLQASKPAKGDVELRMRIDHANKKVDFFDSLDGPVTSATWRRREVIGTVSSDVVSISMWARFHQPGPEWFANPSFGIITSPIREATDEENVRAPD